MLPEVQTYRRLARLTAASQRWPAHQRIRCGSTLLLCSLSLGGRGHPAVRGGVVHRQAVAGPDDGGPGGHNISLDEGHQVVSGGTSSGLGRDRMCSKGLEPSSDKCLHATCYMLRDWWATGAFALGSSPSTAVTHCSTGPLNNILH